MMMRATKWTLGLAAVVVTGLLGTGASEVSAQDGDKPGPAKRDGGGAKGQGQGQDREAMKKQRAEMRAKFREAIEGAKTPLSKAIATVESSTNGKVFRAAYVMAKDGKFTIDVGVIANEKMGTVIVDPESGKASEPKFEEEGAAPAGGGGGQ